MFRHCVFCKENRFLLNQKAGMDIQEAVIYENDRICITPDLAPLTTGHLLVLSQEHFNSFADAPVCVRNDLLCVIRYLSESFFSNTGITWFEHGAVFPDTGGASINHAHLHIIPHTLHLETDIETDHMYCKKIPFSANAFSALAAAQPYLWIGNRYASYIYTVSALPRQYLRQKAASLLDCEDYNWQHTYLSARSQNAYQETIRLYNKERTLSHGDQTNDKISADFFSRYLPDDGERNAGVYHSGNS